MWLAVRSGSLERYRAKLGENKERPSSTTSPASSTVPDISARLRNDPKADPHDKYLVLGNALNWTTNVGYSGYATAAIDEAFNTFVLPTMFAKAARDEMTPEDAVRAGDTELIRIFGKWK